MGALRVPTLRNVAVTPPYMHDGSVATLAEVVRHYSEGGRTLTKGPFAGNGSENPFKDSLVLELALTAPEQSDLVAFLESFTDPGFLTRPELSDPFGQAPQPCR